MAQVGKYKEKHGERSFPSFTFFVETVENLAQQANMPEFAEKQPTGDTTDVDKKENQSTRRQTSGTAKALTTHVDAEVQRQHDPQSEESRREPARLTAGCH